MSEVITLDKRTSHDFGYENRLYSQVLQMQRCGIIAYKLKSREVLMMNPMAKEFYGLDDCQSFTDAELMEAIQNIEFDQPEATIAKLKTLKRVGDTATYTMWTGLGAKTHVMVTTSLIQMSLEELVVVSSLQDISELTLLEYENAQLTEERDYMDMVTGGWNRNGFIREVDTLLALKKKRSDYAIVHFDIKNFKAINEMFGREGGDALLKTTYRAVATGELKPLVVGRMQADHIAAFIKKEDINYDSIVANSTQVWKHNGRDVRLYYTVGIYMLEDDDNISVLQMTERAKLANHSIVDQYVMPYAVFENTMANNYLDQAEILSKFEEGIDNREFKVFYQPVVEAKTGNIVSAEALVRWESRDRGFISPGAFIPTLEKNGHISKLDHYVIQDVFKSIKQRFEIGKTIVPVSVNLSWMDFYDDKMMEWIIEALEDADFPEGHARFEVTETSFAALENNGRNMLDKLRERHALTLLDDFGSGYSSFGMLKSYNFDILKIDLSFIRALETNEKVRYIIDSIVEMCHRIGIKVVAEGAENDTQVEFLKECECDYIQGYYFSKPLPEEKFVEMLENYAKENRIGLSDF